VSYTVLHPVFLDCKVKSGGGSFSTPNTSWTFSSVRPFDTAVNLSTGEVLTLTTADHLTFSAAGNHAAATMVFGKAYTKEVRFSTPYLRDERGNADVAWELQIERVLVNHKDSIQYSVYISLPGSRTQTNTYVNESGVGGFGLNTFGTSQTFVMGNAEDAAVSVINSTPRPSTITGVQFSCWARTKERT